MCGPVLPAGARDPAPVPAPADAAADRVGAVLRGTGAGMLCGQLCIS